MATKKRVNNIKIVKDAINPETPEILAAALIGIDESLKAMRATGFTDDGIATLIAGMRGSNVTKTDVLLVLEGITRLKSYYVKK